MRFIWNTFCIEKCQGYHFARKKEKYIKFIQGKYGKKCRKDAYNFNKSLFKATNLVQAYRFEHSIHKISREVGKSLVAIQQISVNVNGFKPM